MNKKSVSLVATATVMAMAIAACATYKPPQSGSLAKITFSGESNHAFIDTAALDGRSCHAVPVLGGLGEHTIAAGRRLWVQQGAAGSGPLGGFQCTVSYSFMPEEGVSYVSHFSRHPGKCQLHLAKQTSTGLMIESSFKPEPKGCW